MTAPSLVLEHDGRWRHLWVKYVQDVRLDVHCSRSLVGPYDDRVSPDRPGRVAITLDQHEAPLGFYLCGVSRAGYSHNLHVAFAAGGGREDIYRRVPVGGRLSAALFGVHRVAMWEPEEGEYDDLPHGRDPKFHTCRVWRHAVALSPVTA